MAVAGSLEREHFGQQVIIDAYGNGGFRFGGMSHRGSILCLSKGIFAWTAKAPAEITQPSLASLFAAMPAPGGSPGVVLFGMGADVATLPADVAGILRETGCILEVLSTGSALRTYNVLLAENRLVAAALIAVASPRDRDGRPRR
ncbi:MAG: hypothetical protein GXP01_00010 [Alphaproteobacteria bacterium]|nr:hypothetical protein [Alphaproteobacteria bacterium]